jgi:hypothetical protein
MATASSKKLYVRGSRSQTSNESAVKYKISSSRQTDQPPKFLRPMSSSGLKHRISLVDMKELGTPVSHDTDSTVSLPILPIPRILNPQLHVQAVSSSSTPSDQPISRPPNICAPSLVVSLKSVPSAPLINVNDDVTSTKARAERKIKDLEISNTSLLAINRYLEKKIKRQAKDIEQFANLLESANATPIPISTPDSSDDEDDEVMESSLNPEEGINDVNDRTFFVEQAQQRTKTHIEYLKSADEFDKRLRKCLFMTNSLLQDAKKSLEYQVDHSPIGTVKGHDDANESNGDRTFDEDTLEEIVHE